MPYDSGEPMWQSPTSHFFSCVFQQPLDSLLQVDTWTMMRCVLLLPEALPFNAAGLPLLHYLSSRVLPSTKVCNLTCFSFTCLWFKGFCTLMKVQKWSSSNLGMFFYQMGDVMPQHDNGRTKCRCLREGDRRVAQTSVVTCKHDEPPQRRFNILHHPDVELPSSPLVIIINHWALTGRWFPPPCGVARGMVPAPVSLQGAGLGHMAQGARRYMMKGARKTVDNHPICSCQYSW